MRQHAYCEPLEITVGNQFEINHIHYDAHAPYECGKHFHQVHEFIIFENIDGQYHCAQGRSSLRNFDIVFTPALETHFFTLTPRQKAWTIIQINTEMFSQPELASASDVLNRGLHLRLPRQKREDLSRQLLWLRESFANNPKSDLSISLVKLLIIWIAEHSQVMNNDVEQVKLSQRNSLRLKPIMEVFKHAQFSELSLEQTANTCHLSTSYFSRLFKQTFQCNYSEYLMQYKLNLAARKLTQSNMSVTDISYWFNFANPSHFISQFKKQFGVTPKQYRTKFIG